MYGCCKVLDAKRRRGKEDTKRMHKCAVYNSFYFRRYKNKWSIKKSTIGSIQEKEDATKIRKKNIKRDLFKKKLDNTCLKTLFRKRVHI